MVTAQQLRNTTETLSQALVNNLSDPSCPFPPPYMRPNAKWSKLLINSVPTAVRPDRDQAYSPEECHDTLIVETPAYPPPPPRHSGAQLGSSTYNIQVWLILVTCRGFRRSEAKAPLAERYVCAFGTRV